MRKTGRSMRLVGRFMEAAVDRMEAQMLPFLAYLIFNSVRKESRSGQRVFMGCNSVLLIRV